MHFEIDKYSGLDSVLHGWNPGLKIITLVLMIVAASAVTHLYSAVILNIIAVLLCLISGIPLKYFLNKLKYPVYIFTFVFITLVLTSGGKIIYKIGPVNIYYNGIVLAVMIFAKSLSILTFFFLILGTMPFREIINFFSSVGLSPKFTSIIVLVYRYIFQYIETLRKMRTAMILKGYKIRNSIFTFKTTSAITGSLVIRSYEQTERVYKAMILRGFTEPKRKARVYAGIETKDYIISFLFLVLIIAMLYFDKIFLKIGAL